MGQQKTWTFFSLGLFFSITGTLILFSLMVQYENSIEEDEPIDSLKTPAETPFVDGSYDQIDFDAIILNLNQELEDKKAMIEKLSKDNTHLKRELEHKEEELKSKLEEPKFEPVSDVSDFENHLYLKNNKIEVTRL